jgi:hypothetical protein
MYTTTFPCHECARLIIGSGISRLVYIDPYPKSLVPTMYAHEISLTPEGGPHQVRFEAFEGVAPRLYHALFTMSDRSRDPISGRYLAWQPEHASPRLVIEADLDTPIQNLEDAVMADLNDLLPLKADESGPSRSPVSEESASMIQRTIKGSGGGA